jgi:hypothetical protein
VSRPSTSAAREDNPPGDIPDNQAFVAFHGAGTPFTVRVPEGWARQETPKSVVFTDRYNAIRLQWRPLAAAPTVASATAQEIPEIRRSEPAVADATVSIVQRTAGPAVLVTYQADSARNAVTGKVTTVTVERYEFWRNGTEAIVSLSGPVGSDNADPWRTVTDSFQWA